MMWVINSNSNTCRIYEYDKKNAKLSLLKEIEHPENKLKSKDLSSDKPGHYKSSTSSHGAYSQASDPKDVLIEQFYRDIANDLDHGRITNRYNELIIITPPQLNGLLNQHINKHVKERIYKNIQKDMIHLADHELLDYLKDHAKYPEG